MRVLLFIFCFLTGCTFAQSEFEFVPNAGQWDERILYKAEIPSGALYLEEDGLTFNFFDVSAIHKMHDGSRVDSIKAHAYKIVFENAQVPITNLQDLKAGVINYALGNDASKWVSGLKGGTTVLYEEVYPGVDFKIYTVNGVLKYDFIVKPNADPSAIKLRYNGLSYMSLRAGSLFLNTRLGSVKDTKPVALQASDEVEARFILDSNLVTFDIGNYNRNEVLTIDPTLVFSTYSGSFANNFGFTATYDDDGNLYAGGSVFSEGYPTTLGAYDIFFRSSTYYGWNNRGQIWGVSDIGITKYSADGTSRIYSTYLGGNRCELPHSLVVNKRGELFVLGTTSSSNYPTSANAYDQTFNGGTEANLANGIFVNYTAGSDIVVSRLSADGGGLLASTYVGGSANDGLNLNGDLVANYADQMRGEIILDEQENVMIGSSTASSNFPVSAGAYQSVYGGGMQDGVVFKMNENLSTVLWGSFFGGANADGVYSVIKGNNNSIYFAGGTKSDDLNFKANAFQQNYGGGITDGFYANFSANGAELLAGSYVGSPGYDQVYFIREDRSNQIYTFGQSDIFGDYWIRNAAYNSPNSGQFVNKFNDAQTDLEWSTTFGSGENKINISPTAFLVDLCNKVYLTGWGSGSAGFDGVGGNIADGTTGMEVTADAFKSTTDGHDFYLMVLEDDASSLVYGSFFGGDISQEHVDGGTSRFDEKGIIYQSVCAGCGGNNDFPIQPANAVGPTNNGSWFGNAGCNNGVFKFDFGLPNVVADFTTEPVTCANEPITFENQSKFLQNSTILWDFGDGTESSDTNPTHTYAAAGRYMVKLIISDPAACNLTDTAVQKVLVLGGNNESIGTDTTCYNQPTQIGIPPLADTAVTYLWSPSVGLSDTTISNPLATAAQEITYTLVITKNGCSDTLIQTVFPFNSPYTLTNGVTCEDNLAQGTFEGLNYTSFWWSSSLAFNDTLNVFPSGRDFSVLPTNTGANVYHIRASDVNGCTVQDSVLYWVPENAKLLNDYDLCLGDTLVLPLDLFVNEADSLDPEYVWQPASSVIQNDTAVLFMPTQTERYLLLKSYGLRCFDTVVVNINVRNNQPQLLPDSIVCNGYALNFSSSENQVYQRVVWLNSTGDTIGAGRNVQYSPLVGSNEVFIEYTDTFGCVYGDSFIVDNLNFKVKTTADTVTCNLTSPTASIQNYDPNSMASILWETNTQFIGDSTLPSVTISANEFYNQVWVNVTDTAGCFDSDTVIVLNLEIEDYELPPVSICLGEPLRIGIPFDTAATSIQFSWLPSDSVSNPLIANPSVVATDTIQLGLIVDNGTCTDTIPQLINIASNSLKAFGDTTLCNQQPNILLRSQTKNGVTHHWSSNRLFSDTLLLGINEDSLIYPSTLGENTVFVQVFDEIGCTYVDSVAVNIYEYDLQYQPSLEGCSGNFIPVISEGYEIYDSVRWLYGPSPILRTAATDTNALVFGPAGNYLLPITSTSAYGCTDTDFVSVTIGALDTVGINLSTTADTLINNETAVITAFPAGGEYLWQPQGIISQTNGNSITVSITEDTWVTAVVQDPVVSSCAQTDSVFLKFIDSKCLDPYIFVPNAFTPNGDGENDELFVRGRNITDVYFAVFNRWGEKVFETRDISVGWDGYFRGRSADPAVFDWYLQYFCEGQQEFFQKGNVTLIR